MSGNDKESTGPEKTREGRKGGKDFWEKADVMAKIAIPIVIGLFGFWGNQYLSKKQESDNNIKLYTQLLSDKETAENTLRKDMFGKILESFIGGKSEDKKGIEKIKQMRLSLDLLSRNFHESLDMKPLFKHVLMEIVSQGADLRDAIKSLDDALAADGSDDATLKQATLNGKKAVASFSRLNPSVRVRTVTCESSSARKKAEAQRNLVESLLNKFNNERKGLLDSAKRVSWKQREILEEVAGKMTMSFSKKEQAVNLINTTIKPTDGPKDYDGSFKDSGCVITTDRLTFKTIPGMGADTSARHFKMRVRYAYPRWHTVHVEVETWGCIEKRAVRECTRCEKESKKETVSFWLDYFSFPLVDNTFIDNEHRYSVVLEDFDVGKDEEIEKATVTLLYYPASYAGLKEKSFYNNQLLNNLLKSKMFRNDQVAGSLL